jgi:hypothetical protein
MFISILKKVFDSVVRKALMYKLLCKGIGGKLYDLLMHMYSNTLYCCRSKGYISEPSLMGSHKLKPNHQHKEDD